MPRHYDVFLSHSSADEEFVKQLSKELTQYEGFSVFFAKHSIKHGEKISDVLESTRTCRLFVAVLSEEYFTRSKLPMMELAASYTASKDGRGTLPCLLPVFLAIKPDVAKKYEKRTEWLKTWRAWKLNQELSLSERDRISRVEPNVWQDALDALLMTHGPVYIPDENRNRPAMFSKVVARVIAEKLGDFSNTTVPASSSALVPTDLPNPPPTAGAQPPHPGPPPPEPQPRQWDRRLRILVLGDSELVKSVVLHMCGDVKSASVQGHANLTESRSSSSPVCLYYDPSGRGNRVSTDIQSFVEARNKWWHLDQVKGLWKGNKHHRPVGERLALFHGSSERLHMVWYVCRTRSDLPSANLVWPEITEKLYGLPVQILVTGEQAPEDLNREHRDIALRRNDWFPVARNVEELIVKVALTDGDWKENLLRVCWTAKTRAEIGNAAKIITWINEELGPEGRSYRHGVAVSYSKSFSLKQSGELVLNYLCTYWDHVDSQHLFFALHDTLEWGETNKVIIQPVRGFVLFCLQVAAIILYSASNPEYGRVPAELVKVKAQDCLRIYFQESSYPAAYDSMTLPDLQAFLESVFEGQDLVAKSLMRRPEDRSSRPFWKNFVREFMFSGIDLLLCKIHSEPAKLPRLDLLQSKVRAENPSGYYYDFGKHDDLSTCELMHEEIMKIDNISEASLKDLEGEETIILCNYIAKDDLLEFYFKNGEDMTSVVGVGLDYAKAILIEGWKVKVEEIFEEDWVQAWKKVESSSNPQGSYGNDNRGGFQEALPKWFNSQKKQGGNNGEDNNDDEGNDNKGKAPDPSPSDGDDNDLKWSKVFVDLLPGGDVLEESKFSPTERKKLRTLDGTISPHLEFSFQKKSENKEIEVIVGNVQFNLGFAKHGGSDQVKWIHDDMGISFGLQGDADNQALGELVRNSFKHFDIVNTRKETMTESHTNEKRKGKDYNVEAGLYVKPHGVGLKVNTGGKHSKVDANSQQHERSSETSCAILEGGMKFRQIRDSNDERQIRCEYFFPHEKDGHVNLSTSPMSFSQDVSFQTTWRPLDVKRNGISRDFVVYTLEVDRNLEEIVGETTNLEEFVEVNVNTSEAEIPQHGGPIKYIRKLINRGRKTNAAQKASTSESDTSQHGGPVKCKQIYKKNIVHQPCHDKFGFQNPRAQRGERKL